MLEKIEGERKMSVNVERLSENSVKLTIEVEASTFSKALDKAFEKVVKEVKVDGFRPGKMPKNMFIQRFGVESLYSDAVQFVLDETYPNALMEAKVFPTDSPKIDLDYTTLKQGEGFTYTVTVDVWPEVHLGNYKGLEVEPLSTRVTKKDVDQEIDKVLEQRVENVLKDGAAEKGDTVVIDFEGFVDGVAFDGGKAENYALELGSNSFVPGFEDQLIGSKPEDEVEVKVTFPKDYHESLANKDAIFKVKVHEVKTKVKPELTDELIKELDVANVSTVDEYLEHLKKEIKTKKEEEAKRHLENALVDALCAASYAEFPDSLINNEIQEQVKRVEDQAKQYKMPVELLLQYSGVSSMDDYKKRVEEYTRKSFLQELAFEKIMEIEGIKATDEEIEKEYASLASANGQEANLKNINEVKKRYPKHQVEYHVKALKVMELLKANASIKNSKK